MTAATGAPAGAGRAAAAAVRLEAVGREFRAGGIVVRALRDASAVIRPGEVVALVGRSGAGKTTLLNCVGGLDRPTSGRIEVDGVDVTALDERGRTALRRDRVSTVFQTFGLLPMLTAAENVGLPLRLRRASADEREERVAHLLDLVGLARHAAQRPEELSGGQQQRVAIARALVGRPRLLIADEPTGQLDAGTALGIRALLRDVVREEGATALISSHDPAMREIADRTLRMVDGVLDEPA